MACVIIYRLHWVSKKDLIDFVIHKKDVIFQVKTVMVFINPFLGDRSTNGCHTCPEEPAKIIRRFKRQETKSHIIKMN